MERSLPPFSTAAALAVAILLAGCIGPAAPVAANGLVIGAEQIPVELNLAEPVDAVAFLAVPLSVTDLESNAVAGADVWIDIDASTTVDLPEEGTGLYAYDPASAPADGLRYEVGATYRLHAEVDAVYHSVTMEAPPPPLLHGAPELGAHPSGAGLTFDLSGQGFDYASYVVIDQNGEVRLDGLPEDGAELILDLRDANGVTSVTVPAGVMVGSSVPYTVAILAVRKADKVDFEGFGRFWSEFGMGSYAVVPVLTEP